MILIIFDIILHHQKRKTLKEMTTTTAAPTIIEIAELLNSHANQAMTVFKTSEFGFPLNMKCKLLKAEVKPYAQYEAVLFIDLILKGKRKPLRFRIMDYSDLLVYVGHIDLNSEMYVKTIQGDGYTLKESELAFSKNYFTRAMASTTEQPIIKILK